MKSTMLWEVSLPVLSRLALCTSPLVLASAFWGSRAIAEFRCVCESLFIFVVGSEINRDSLQDISSLSNTTTDNKAT